LAKRHFGISRPVLSTAQPPFLEGFP